MEAYGYFLKSQSQSWSIIILISFNLLKKKTLNKIFIQQSKINPPTIGSLE